MNRKLFRQLAWPLLLALGVLTLGIPVQAQTITTTFTNNNGSGLATFNFTNSGSSPVMITEIGSVCGSSTTQTVSAWYKPSAISGLPGPITTTNGWTQFASGTIMGIANTTTSTAQIFFPTSTSTITPLIVPPGTTYGIAVSATSLRYSTLAAGTYTITGGSCSIVTGTNVGYGGAVPPAAPTNTPRGFIGYVTFISTAPCSGTPSAAITSSVTSACAGTPFTLNATPTGMTGYTYLFEVSTDGGTFWSSLAPASSSPSYTVPSQTVASQYRVTVTCSGGSSNISAPISISQNPPTECYCTPATTGGTTYYITNLTTTGGTININKTSGSSATGYQDFHTTDSAKAFPGTTINYSIAVAGGSTYGRSIWIDFNEDGIFQSTEQVASSTTYEFPPLTGSFTIPMSTTPGKKRMRIIASFTPANPNDPCTNSGSGEYEDYTLVVVPLPPCTGTPVAGTAVASPNVICTGGSAGLNLSGYTSGVTGISIEWQSAGAATGPFTPVSGATAPSYDPAGITAPTYYRAKVTCAGSGLFAFSDTVGITLNNPVIIDNTPASRCDPGTLTLGATPGTGAVIKWYDAPTGGTLLATGPSYTTPSLSTTTTYYAQAVAEVLDDTVGLTTSLQAWYMNAPAYMTFNAFSDFTLESVMVYPYNSTGSPTGTITISLEDASGTILGTVTEAVSGTLVPVTPVTINLGFEVPAGSNYKLNISSSGIDGYLIDENPAFPYTLPGALAITDGYVDAGDIFYWGTYNWHIKVGCESELVPVAATIGGLPTIVAQPLGDTLCEGQTLALNVDATGADTYQWYGPAGMISGATTATYTIPSIALSDIGDYSVEVIGPAGCGSVISDLAHILVGTPGQWMGFSSDWSDGSNWCGGVPTATSNIIIPAASTITFEPVVATGTTAQVHNLSIMSSTVTVNGELEIYGNATATAGGALDAISGSINLAGTTTQNIGVGFNAANLSSNGGGQKNLANDVIVTGNLSLNSGILDVGSTTLTLWPGATLTGGSATAYIKAGSTMGGLKQEVGAGTARFPVGNSAYNPATLSNSGTPDNFTIRVHDAVLEAGYSGAPVAPPTYVVNRTWDISKESSTAANATLTLQWNSGEENSSLFDLSHVYIAHYTAGAWQNTCCPSAELAPAASGSGPYTVSQSGLSSFSPFTVSSAGGAPLSISTASQGSFTIEAYPNPVSDELTVAVKGGSGRQATVSIIDMTGRELMARYVENGRAAFSMKQLAAGVYFVKYSDGQVTQTLKINKQ